MTERVNMYARATALGILVAVIGIAAFGRFYTARFNGLPSTTAIEAAEVAQQLRFGEGMTTKVIYPLALSYADVPDRGSMPQTRRAPLYPATLSLLFRVRGGGDASVAMLNGLMFLLTGWGIFVIGRMLWDKSIAILAVLAYFISIASIGAALSGTGASLAGLLMVGGLWAALRGRMAAATDGADGVQLLRWPIIAGAAFGLAWLSGMTSLLLAIPLAVLVGVGKNRWRPVAALLVTAAIVTTPWFLYTWHRTGTPVPTLAAYELISNTRTHPGQSVFQKMPDEVTSPLGFVLAHPGDMAWKIAEGFAMIYRGGPEQFTPYLFPFFVLGIFVFARNSLERSLWRIILAMFVVQALSISLWGHDLHGLQIVMPMGLLLSIAALVQAMRSTETTRRTQFGVAIVLAALVSFPTVSSAILGGKAPSDPTLHDLQLMRELLAPDALIATDQPGAASWYAGLSAVALPETPMALMEIAAAGADADYIFLSRSMLMNPTGEWARVASGQSTEEEAALMGTPVALFGNDEQSMVFLFERHERRAPGVTVHSPVGS